MTLVEIFFRWAHWTLFLLGVGLLVLAALTPWRKPGGMPHREHVGLCAVGLNSLAMIVIYVREPDDGVAAMICLLAAILLVIGIRSFRAGRAAQAAARLALGEGAGA